MTEKKSSIPFEDIMRRIEQRQYAPVYILMGDESYYIDQIADAIANSVLKPEEQDFNQTILFGADVTAAQVVDIAKGYPMMSSHRVVIVKEAQNVKSLDALEKYLVNPMPTTILVWCYKNGLIDKRKKVVAKAESVGIVFESKKKRDYELNTFINKYLKAKNVQIDAKSSDMIAEHVGADLSRLVSELDKIILSLDDKNRIITPEMVEQKIGISKEFNTFELRSAIINKDVYKANLIINYFENN